MCQEPVTNIFEDSTCVLHIQLPAQRIYALKVRVEYNKRSSNPRFLILNDLQKYESESEEETTPKPSTSTSASLTELKEEPTEEQVLPPQPPKEEPKPEDPQVETKSAPLEQPQKQEVIKTEASETEDTGTNITICHEGVKQDDSDVIVLETTQTEPTIMHSESTGGEPMEE